MLSLAVLLSGCYGQKPVKNQTQEEKVIESASKTTETNSQKTQNTGKTDTIDEIDTLMDSISESDYNGDDLSEAAINEGVEQE